MTVRPFASTLKAACTFVSLSGSAKAVASSRISTGAFFQHGAGDGQPLGFAAGEVNALRTDDRAHAVREFLDDIHALRGAERRQHFPQP